MKIAPNIASITGQQPTADTLLPLLQMPVTDGSGGRASAALPSAFAHYLAVAPSVNPGTPTPAVDASPALGSPAVAKAIDDPLIAYFAGPDKPVKQETKQRASKPADLQLQLPVTDSPADTCAKSVTAPLVLKEQSMVANETPAPKPEKQNIAKPRAAKAEQKSEAAIDPVIALSIEAPFLVSPTPPVLSQAVLRPAPAAVTNADEPDQATSSDAVGRRADSRAQSVAPLADRAQAFADLKIAIGPTDSFNSAIAVVQPERTVQPSGQAPLISAASPLAEPNAVIVRELDLFRGNEWLDQLASDIIAATNRSDRMSFRLRPANLGQMDVSLSQGVDGLSVQFGMQSEEAGRIISAAQPRLVESLQGQGVRIAETRVLDVSNNQGTPTLGQSQTQAQAQAQFQGQGQRPASGGHFIETSQMADAADDAEQSRPAGRFA